MASPVIRSWDYSAEWAAEHQLMMDPATTAQTVITGALLADGLRGASFAEAIQVVNVEKAYNMTLSVWGVAQDNGTAVLDAYVWGETGPGIHAAKLTITFANFTSAASTGFHAQSRTHPSIKNVFLPGTAYRGIDTMAVTNIYHGLFSTFTLGDDTPLDFLCSFNLNRCVKYIGFVPNTFTNVTSVGMIGRIGWQHVESPGSYE